MDANVALGLQLSAWRSSDNVARRSSISFHKSNGENSWSNFQTTASCDLRCRKRWNVKRATMLEVSHSSHKFQVSVIESRRVPTVDDTDLLLKNKSEDIAPLLEGRCIYLVGMMGSGKTTVGRIMSEALKYSFFDCDKLIEEGVGGTTVSEIFQLYGESFFRDKETAALKELSSMQQLVVSTGGGAVLRPINWRYMQKGLSVWLDVPLEALARRIAAVGTESRPLLNGESGDAYTKAFKRLSTLLKDRGEAYANANVRVSLEDMAVKYAFDDVCKLTPEMIAVEVLIQIENFLKNKRTIS